MDTQMKLLIAYDGSTSADTALDDLLRAGLPAEAQATVIGVADIFMPGVAGSEGYDPKAAMLSYGSSAVERRLEQVSHALEEARRWAAATRHRTVHGVRNRANQTNLHRESRRHHVPRVARA